MNKGTTGNSEIKYLRTLLLLYLYYYTDVKLFMDLKIPTNDIFKHNTSANSLEHLDGFLEKSTSLTIHYHLHYQALGRSLVDYKKKEVLHRVLIIVWSLLANMFLFQWGTLIVKLKRRISFYPRWFSNHVHILASPTPRLFSVVWFKSRETAASGNPPHLGGYMILGWIWVLTYLG